MLTLATYYADLLTTADRCWYSWTVSPGPKNALILLVAAAPCDFFVFGRRV